MPSERLLVPAALLLGACASFAPERGHAEVAKNVEERLGTRTRWNAGSPEDAQIAGWVKELLQGGLTRGKAVEIALVNNHELQATYEELGISQAEAIQAGLLKNPRLGGSFGVPLPGGGIAEFEMSLVEDVLDLFMLPARQRLANDQFDADVLRVSHEALGVAAAAEKAFLTYVARRQELALRREFVDAENLSADFAGKLFDAGNITEVARDNALAAAAQARLDLQADELAVSDAREELNRLLGLGDEATTWEAAETLPKLPEADPAQPDLEATALARRLDVMAARKKTALLREALDLASTYRFIGSFELGVHGHRDTDGGRLIGPVLSLELPIFDQRQALLARLDSERRQGERRLAELTTRARSEVRQARTHLLAAREMVARYQQELEPLRRRLVEGTLLQYNAMQVGLPELLLARQRAVETSRGSVEAQLAYWTARVELDRALGGRPAHEGTAK